MKGIDPANPRIQELQRLVDDKSKEQWASWELSEIVEEFSLDTHSPFYQALKKTIEEWDPSPILLSLSIPIDHYSDEQIKQMNQAWDTYYVDSMNAYKEDKNFEVIRGFSRCRYRIPPSFYELGDAIHPNSFDTDEEDPITSWATSYILEQQHPLTKM